MSQMDLAGRSSPIIESDKALKIRLNDVFRATLAQESGNLGYLGLSPDGSAYHVVVPVDIQIARGVMAGNRPLDGTPFGGYSGWIYYECAPYESLGLSSREQLEARRSKAASNAKVLAAWAKGRGMDVEVIDP